MKTTLCFFCLFCLLMSVEAVGQNLPFKLIENTHVTTLESLPNGQLVMMKASLYNKCVDDESLADFVLGFSLWLLDECYNQTLFYNSMDSLAGSCYYDYYPISQTDYTFGSFPTIKIDDNGIIHIASFNSHFIETNSSTFVLQGINILGESVYLYSWTENEFSFNGSISLVDIYEDDLFFNLKIEGSSDYYFLNLDNYTIESAGVNNLPPNSLLSYVNEDYKIFANASKVSWVINQDTVKTIQADFLSSHIGRDGVVYQISENFPTIMIIAHNIEGIQYQVEDSYCSSRPAYYVDEQENFTILNFESVPNWPVSQLFTCYKKFDKQGQKIADISQNLTFQSMLSNFVVEGLMSISSVFTTPENITLFTTNDLGAVDVGYNENLLIAFNNNAGMVFNTDTLIVEVFDNELNVNVPTFKTIQPCEAQQLISSNYGGACPYQNTVWVGDIEHLDDPTSPTPTFQTCESGTYNLTYVVEDGEGNIAKAKLTIHVPFPPQQIFLQNWD